VLDPFAEAAFDESQVDLGIAAALVPEGERVC
jgi:hypothetical protein